MPPAGSRAANNEQITGAFPPIFIIMPLSSPWLGGDHLTGLNRDSHRNRPPDAEDQRARHTGPAPLPYAPRTQRSRSAGTTLRVARASGRFFEGAPHRFV